MERHTPAAVERAMKVQEVLLQARNKTITWLEAADILNLRPRTMRRWKWRMEHGGIEGLFDRRCRTPSPRRTPTAEVDRVLALYRNRYTGFNVRHFHETVSREHGVTLSYSLVKQILQGAGLVRKGRIRGRHRQRRERRPCLGEVPHVDGSPHRWLALAPELRPTLISVVDDATSRPLYLQLWPSETTRAIMTALGEVFVEHGLPQSIYTDEASWAACTRGSRGRPRPERPARVQRALDRLGIEHIHAHSPQARGRSERMNRTLQGRLVHELRVAGITTLADANRYLHEVYRPRHNQRFAVAAADRASGFTPLLGVALNHILCLEATRRVKRDNTVVLNTQVLQLPPTAGHLGRQRQRVLVRRHLEGTCSVWRGPRCLARYQADERLIGPDPAVTPGHDRGAPRILHSQFRHARPDHLSKPAGHITCS
jgi:transposase